MESQIPSRNFLSSQGSMLQTYALKLNNLLLVAINSENNLWKMRIKVLSLLFYRNFR